jgi:hypothetical protein
LTVWDSRIALRACTVLEEVAGEASVARGGRRAEIAASNQKGALGAGDAGEAVVGVAGRADSGRGA